MAKIMYRYEYHLLNETYIENKILYLCAGNRNIYI